MSEIQRKTAEAARKLYAGEITYDQFIDICPEEEEDELCDGLIDLIVHEPQKGGFLGVSEKEHEAYIQQIFSLIEKIENNAT